MSKSKEQSKKATSFKPASLEQLWSCLQRYLLFEEPSSRWTRLISSVSRLASGKTRDLSSLPLNKQQECFQSVFGTPPDLLDQTSRFLNLLLALKELRSFEADEFEIFYLSQNESGQVEECPNIFYEIAETILGQKALESQALSLYHAFEIVPYWRLLESFGPWSGDPLAEFISAFMHKLDRLDLSLSAEAILEAEKAFALSLRQNRPGLPFNFQPDLIVLVEGNTESVLLPRFFKLASPKTADLSPLFQACGGANQVLRRYLHLRDKTRLPILVVIDRDALEQIDTLEKLLRPCDALHIWKAGEIEDTFEPAQLLAAVNAYLQQFGSSEFISVAELSGNGKRTEVLNKLWRRRGLGDFDKVGFAEFQAGRLKSSLDLPWEGKQLVETIRIMAARKNGKL